MVLFQNRWWIPVAACIGIMVGLPSVLIPSFPVFLKPVTASLGWTRGMMSSAPAVTGLFTLVARPLLGWLIDRFGFKRAMLPGLLSILGPYTFAQDKAAARGPVAAVRA